MLDSQTLESITVLLSFFPVLGWDIFGDLRTEPLIMILCLISAGNVTMALGLLGAINCTGSAGLPTAPTPICLDCHSVLDINWHCHNGSAGHSVVSLVLLGFQLPSTHTCLDCDSVFDINWHWHISTGSAVTCQKVREGGHFL